MGLGRTRRDDTNVFDSPRVHDNEQPAHRAHAKRYESLLIRIGFIISNRDRIRLVKNRNRFGHADAVLAKVDPGLPASSHSKPTPQVYLPIVHTSIRALRPPEGLERPAPGFPVMSQ